MLLSQKALAFLATPERRTPDGASFSENFTMGRIAVRDAVSRALAAIDAVHGDGGLPIISVGSSPANSHYRARYESLQEGSGAFRAYRILVRRGGATAEIDFCHEAGHYLSEQGWAGVESAAEELPTIAWMRWAIAVDRSDAARMLSAMQRHGRADVYLPGGGFVEEETDQNYLNYLLRPEELWARCYAQFIALKSGDTELREQLNAMRESVPGEMYYPEHWTDADFDPILTTIEEIFRERGWL